MGGGGWGRRRVRGGCAPNRFMQMGVWAHEDGQIFESLGYGAAPRIRSGLSTRLRLMRSGRSGVGGRNTINDTSDIRRVLMHNV